MESKSVELSKHGTWSYSGNGIHSFSDAESGQFDDAESGSDLENGSDYEYDPNLSLLDSQFEVMLHRDYHDEMIGELDDDIDALRGDLNLDDALCLNRNVNKDSLRYKWNRYLKRRRKKVTKRLKKVNRDVTLAMMGIDPYADSTKKVEATMKEKDDEKGADDEDEEESEEIIYFSDSDHGSDDKDGANWKELESDDERRIDAEIDEEFQKAPPPKWDVESILSTRTNHENHPKELEMVKDQEPMEKVTEDGSDDDDDDLKEEKVRNGMQFNFGSIGGNADGTVVERVVGNKKVFEFTEFGQREEVLEDMENSDDSDEADDTKMTEEEQRVRAIIAGHVSRKGETKEQKKERRRLQKEMRRQRKKEKKANKLAFKEAKKRNVKMDAAQIKSHGNALRL